MSTTEHQCKLAAFEQAAAPLPFFSGLDIDAAIVLVEPIDAPYFRNNHRQRCIIRRADGRLYVAYYD